MAETTEFTRINIKADVKREIDLIAAAEQRNVYAVVSDMLEVYKAVKIKAQKKPKAPKPVTIAEFIASR